MISKVINHYNNIYVKSKERECIMRSKMLWIVLTLLSFNILHDSFMVLLDQNRHTSVVCCTGSEVPMQECDESCETHKIFHIMAIVTTEKSGWIRFQKKLLEK